LNDLKELRKQLESGRTKAASAGADELLAGATHVGPAAVIVAETPGLNETGLRGLIDQLRKKAGSAAVLLAAKSDERVLFAAGVTKDLEARGVHAGQWVNVAAEATGGRGGGRPDMAQAGGKDPAKTAAALEAARTAVLAKLKG
jgi:alanyl-tRNA synthetase